ncbi:MAG: sigma 54-interacting transcriptional regulator [Acidobacteriota bacterium]|nr:sigma 54-interacting transcriptional regulator [Acidobacteriota bacterium]
MFVAFGAAPFAGSDVTMPFRLLLHLDRRIVRRPLLAGPYELGSGSLRSGPGGVGVDVQVRHPSVSRRHALLVVEDGTVRVEDLGSRNGTWVDGRRIHEAVMVEPGMEVRFGSVQGELEAATEEDLEAAVDLSLPPAARSDSGATAAKPLDERADASSTEQADRTGGTHAPTTASLAPAQAFFTTELPELLATLAGKNRLQAAQAVGAALFRRLPCTELEIAEVVGERPALLFSGRRDLDDEEAREDALLPVEVRRGGLRVRAGFLQAGVARSCGAVLETALHLLHLCGEDLRRPPEPRARKLDAGEEAPLPEPPTLEPAVQEIYRQARRVARGEVGVLIRGESGTGKEVLARFLHAASRRAQGPFVTLNCAALPGDLLESELFGIERGVATGVEARPGKFEAADGGTLFLDEIGDMAVTTQAKILRVLQEGEVHRLGGTVARPARARILAATHQDLESMLAAGGFRADLYHRIAGWEVTLPPLRRRRRDIPNLAAYFLQQEAQKAGVRPAGISRAAVQALLAYSWPGNIRQLATEIARAALFLGDDELLDTALLQPHIASSSGAATGTGLKATLETVEREEIQLALEATGGSVPQAAERLDVAVSTLYRRMKALGLSADDSEES